MRRARARARPICTASVSAIGLATHLAGHFHTNDFLTVKTAKISRKSTDAVDSLADGGGEMKKRERKKKKRGAARRLGLIDAERRRGRSVARN